MSDLRSLITAIIPRPIRTRLYALLKAALPARFGSARQLVYRVRKLTREAVYQGPFAGMKYVESSVGSAYLPKLLGTYERELHPIVETIASGGFELFVNVGAGEGYYAVGFARRCPELKVVTFERDPRGQEALRELAAKNQISRISVHGNCEPEDLTRALDGARRSLVVCDIEGGELQILDPARCPALGGAHILVELHEFAASGIGETLRQRFEATHHIEQIWEGSRTLEDFPLKSLHLSILPADVLLAAVREWRPERMSWFWMTPRAQSESKVS